MMDSECQWKTERTSVSSRNTTNSLSSGNSEQQGGMQSFSGRKEASPGIGSMPSCRVRDFIHPSSEGITSKPPCKESEEVWEDYLTPGADTHNWTSIYDDCSTEAGSIEMFDGSKINPRTCNVSNTILFLQVVIML
jgi:hypothetical protein